MEKLIDYHLTENPWDNFQNWYTSAQDSDPQTLNQATLATIDLHGAPNARTILFKGIHQEGLGFFTNYESQKALEIKRCPQGCLVFWWPKLGRQIIVKGPIEKAPEKYSQNYFSSRDRGSQIGAHASQQSRPLESREKLQEIVERKKQEFADQEIPRPDNWGGYLLSPHYWEFFLYQTDRLNDRFQFTKVDHTWKIMRVYP